MLQDTWISPPILEPCECVHLIKNKSGIRKPDCQRCGQLTGSMPSLLILLLALIMLISSWQLMRQQAGHLQSGSEPDRSPWPHWAMSPARPRALLTRHSWKILLCRQIGTCKPSCTIGHLYHLSLDMNKWNWIEKMGSCMAPSPLWQVVFLARPICWYIA